MSRTRPNLSILLTGVALLALPHAGLAFGQ